jgi:predicted NBD/HSP70 family sugar kinase
MNNQKTTKLIDMPVPGLLNAQLDKFSFESVRSKESFRFDPNKAKQLVSQHENESVIGIDLGGDKAVSYLYKIKQGRLEIDESFSEYAEGDDGEGFLASFEKVAEFANKNNLAVGISYGAPVSGTKPIKNWPKFRIFLEELTQKYKGDFANIFLDRLTVLNDAPAGLISGALESKQRFGADNILYVINGSGMNAAGLKNGSVIAMEAGHVEAAAELNKYGQAAPCNVNGAAYTCLQSLGANKYGVESIWQFKNGEDLSAKAIEDRYKAGDEFARDLYDYSALVVAHMVVGVAKATDINLASPETAVIAHGGAFRFPNYIERVKQIIDKHLESDLNIVRTEDYTKNACAEGAAVAVLTI